MLPWWILKSLLTFVFVPNVGKVCGCNSKQNKFHQPILYAVSISITLIYRCTCGTFMFRSICLLPVYTRLYLCSILAVDCQITPNHQMLLHNTPPTTGFSELPKERLATAQWGYMAINAVLFQPMAWYAIIPQFYFIQSIIVAINRCWWIVMLGCLTFGRPSFYPGLWWWCSHVCV